MHNGQLAPHRAGRILQGRCLVRRGREDQVGGLCHPRDSPPFHAGSTVGRDLHLLCGLVGIVESETVALQVHTDIQRVRRVVVDDCSQQYAIAVHQEARRHRADEQGFGRDKLCLGLTYFCIHRQPAHIHLPGSERVGQGHCDLAATIRVRDERGIPVGGIREVLTQIRYFSTTAAAHAAREQDITPGIGRDRKSGLDAERLVAVERRQDIRRVRVGDRQGGKVHHREGELTFHRLALVVRDQHIEGDLIARPGFRRLRRDLHVQSLVVRCDRDVDQPAPEVVALAQHGDADVDIWRFGFRQRQRIFPAAA